VQKKEGRASAGALRGLKKEKGIDKKRAREGGEHSNLPCPFLFFLLSTRKRFLAFSVAPSR